MPLYKRHAFVPMKPPPDLKPDEEVFYLKLTNEIFRNYDEYFDRMILCNSLVWSCALTGKANLTFQEAVESETAAKKVLKGLPKELKKALFYLVTLTERGKVLDVYEDVFIYARERYFKGEIVLGVIGNLWCPSRVLRVIYPSKDEIETYKQEQIEKGEYERNDYLTDDSWGPPPDLFRYEVQETDPDSPELHEVHILEAIDVKREKTILTRDKCRFLIKLATHYCDNSRRWELKEDVSKSFSIPSCRFEELFVGPAPRFESTLGPPPRANTSAHAVTKKSKVSPEAEEKPKRKPKEDKEATGKPGRSKKGSDGEKEKKKPRSKSLTNAAPKQKGTNERKSLPPEGVVKERKKPGPKPKKEKEPKPVVEKKLTQQELKQIESERKAIEREKQRNEKKLIADFKKLWFKPKEDLEVEDLKDLPTPDPVSCKIPNHLFGDFIAVLEFFNCYANTLKVRDCFNSGINFDALERALTKNEIAGPLSDILQLIMKAIFRLEEAEHADINHEQTAGVELEVDETGNDVSVNEAVDQATTAATWCTRYQGTALHKLNLDHLSLSEVLRLHLLASGARPSEKDVKWRYQNRGFFDSQDDPGLRLRIEEPQILKTLSHGTVFDLSITEKLKLITALMNQFLTYFDVREAMEDSFEQFKQSRLKLRSLQAEEKRKEAEDHLWKSRLRADKVVPDPNSLKAGAEKDKGNEEEKPDAQKKPMLTDEQIEALIEKKDKEIAKRKQEVSWKEAELLDSIIKHERKLGIHPIGRDRAFRRFWIFNTLPGLFVELDDENVGTCLPQPTPHLSEVNLNDVNFVKENMNKLRNNDREGSDKENSTLASPKKSPKKKQQAAKVKDIIAVPRPNVFGICTGDTESCPVHCKYLPRPKWYFFWSPEQLDTLIDGLSPRGIREKDLKQVLIDEKEGLVNLLKRCPVSKLNVDNVYPEYMLSIAERKAQRGGQHSTKHLDPNLNYPEGTEVDNILELQLRDMILEMEEKVFLGTLGSLKVKDRQLWRKAIEERSYDRQADDLKWGRSKSILQENASVKKNSAKREDSDADEVESTATSTSARSENRTSGETITANPVVRDLASAILQFSQSVEPKFLKKPLGTKDDTKVKTKNNAATEHRTVEPALSSSTSPLERWELSLMASTSLSQLFMHLFTLDNSIEWSRSVLNARCRICRRKGDPDQMLLCDDCNKGHHAYCLKPPLQVIPKGDWYCAECRPAEPPPKVNRRKRNQYLSEEDILDELENGSDEDSGEEAQRGSRQKRNDKGKANGPSNIDSDGAGDPEVCEICELGGQVMCCDNCPKLYHLQCLDPPKTRVPRGSWYCPDCCGNGKRGSKKKSKVQGKSNKAKKAKPRRIISDSSDEESSAAESEENNESGSEVSEEETNCEETAEFQDTKDNMKDENQLSDSNESDNEEIPKMKVRIGGMKPTESCSKNTNDSSSSLSARKPRKKYFFDSDEEESADDEPHGRGSKRKSASAAAERISKVAKRLRSDSKENDSSENSNDSSFQHSRKKRSYESDGNDAAGSGDGPKRTRLQRMHKNQCAEDGELDNVLMDRLLKDVMKHTDAWPFLKPVTKADAPDYHDIIKNPMDLGTIKYKLNSMVYSCNEEVISDLMLVFSNCLLYNDPTHAVSKAGQSLKNFCERRCSKLGIHFSDEPPVN